MSGLRSLIRRTFGGRDYLDGQLLTLDLFGRTDRARAEALIRARCATAYLHGTDALCWALGRYRMVVDTADIGLSTFLMLDGFWEMWVTEVIAQAIRPGMSVVDCGANLGYYTLIAADRVGAGGRVHAIEPNPALAERLRRSLVVNGYDQRTTIHEIALSDAAREVAFRIPADEPKNGHITYLAAHEAAAEPDCIVVPALPLDTLLGDAAVDFIKIDVEGAEEAVWRGMAGIFARGRPMTIFLEFASIRYPDAAGFLAEIAAHGFSLAVIELSGEWRTIDAATLLARPGTIDQMLLLRR